MLQLYDLNKIKIAGLKNYKDYCIESNLSSGDKKLSFLYPLKLANEIVPEGYVQTRTAEFVIKELGTAGEWKTIKAILNTEDLEGNVFEHFDTTNKTINESITLALAGTGWTVGTCNVTRRRTVRKTNSSSWEIIQEAKKNYRAEIEFDTLNKKINIFEKRGTDKGTYFIESLNLKDLDVQSNSYDFYTRIMAIGKDDLRVTLENYQYSSKRKTFIWVDDRYTDKNALTEDAMSKLNELSKPYRAYSANVIDLASMNAEYKDILSYGLGDTITLISKDKEIKEKQRIVKIVEYPEECERNTCEIANTTLKFEDLQKEFQDTSNTVNNITVDDGTIDGNAINGIGSKKIYDLEANVVRITDLTAVNAKIEHLYADKADIGSLNAVIANIGILNATKANITDLKAINASITDLKADKANILDLKATNAKINVLEVNTGNIQTLLAGNLTSTNIQSLNLTSDKVTVANGFIKNAMIDTVDLGKVNAGIINTNKFTIKSADGGIEIVGATQQFKDKNGKVRIQMGKDTQGNFNFILRGEDGVTALIDHTGIKKDAIANDLIVKEMIGADAIGEKQLDYSSFAEGFNKDTNTHTLKATHIKLDNSNQTLDLAFNSLKTEVQNIEIGGRNLILNSGAEKGLNSWIKPETVGTVTVETVNAYEGNNAFRILYAGTAGYQTLRQDVIVEPNVNMNLSGYIKVLQALGVTNTQVKLGINCYNQIGQMTGGFVSTILSEVTTIFTKVGVSFTTPLNTSKITIILLVINGEALFDNIKLETGTKATGYTVAPEDVDKSINAVKEITTSNSTTIGIQQGQIDVAIANSQIIKGGKTIWLKDDYNLTVQTVNSTTETIGQHKTVLDANTKGIKEVTTDVTEVKKSLEGITTRVGSSETSIDGINKSVSTANSEIAQLKDSISLKVGQTNIDTAITNIVVGGRNLIRNSSKPVTTNSWSGAIIRNSILLGENTFIITNTSLTSEKYASTQRCKLEGGKEYTFSIKVFLETNVDSIDVFFLMRKKDSIKDWDYAPQFINMYKSIKGEWITLTATMKIPIDVYEGYIRIDNNKANGATGNTLWFTNIKLEEGNKATSYVSAPEDVDQAIADTITVNETKINEAKAEILLETNAIKLAVSSVDSTVTATTKTANSALTNASTAQTQANLGVANAKGALDKANNVDGKVTTLTTTVTNTNTKVAGIEISLEAITSKVTNLESIETSNRKVGSFRYIRDWLNGSNVNTGNYWCELEVWVGDTNIARGKAATSSVPLVNGNLLTDGSIATTPYVSMASVGWQWVQIDLGTERKDVDMIRTFHYWYDSRQFRHKLQVSTDGATWVDLYNSDISGAYIETNRGRSYVINESYTESRLNSAEEKITDNAIISTVQATINTAQNNAINSANATTAGKLNAYATTSAMTSAITQSANSVKTEISNTYITTGNANNSFATKSSVTQSDAEWRATFKSSGGYNLIPNGKALLNTNGWRNNGGTRFNREYYEMGSAFAMSMPNGINFEGWIKLERGVDYVYSAKFYSDVAGTGSASTPLHYWVGTSEANNSYITVIDHNQGTILARWQDLYVHFITRPDVDTFFKPFIYGGPTTAVASITNIMLAKGTMVTPWVPNSNEVYSGNTSIDSGGVTIYNGALRVLDGAGNEVLKGDANGVSFSGRLQPRDNQIKLFGEDCKLEGGYGALRRNYNSFIYDAVTQGGSWILYNGNSQNGTKYAGIYVDGESHVQLYSQTTMLKLLNTGAPSVQARWAGDGGYCMMQASSFTVSSKAEYKDNIEDPIDVDFIKILMKTDIKKYNLRKEMELVDKMPTVILPDGSNPIKVDTKLGLIIDNLEPDAMEVIHPRNSDGADLYNMVSILWKVNQEQEKRIEKLEQLLIM